MNARVCNYCKVAAPEPGRSRCGPCAVRCAELRRARYQSRKAAGLCRVQRCREFPLPGHAFCAHHRAVRAKSKAGADREPTMEELEAVIAEQMQCLPAWWSKETRRVRKGVGE